jgi:hypothetical protein
VKEFIWNLPAQINFGLAATPYYCNPSGSKLITFPILSNYMKSSMDSKQWCVCITCWCTYKSRLLEE